MLVARPQRTCVVSFRARPGVPYYTVTTAGSTLFEEGGTRHGDIPLGLVEGSEADLGHCLRCPRGGRRARVPCTPEICRALVFHVGNGIQIHLGAAGPHLLTGISQRPVDNQTAAHLPLCSATIPVFTDVVLTRLSSVV
jgi:hypothetical protein